MSILGYLESLAGDALHLPGEKRKVRDATEKLGSRVREYFGDLVIEQFKFGSSVRGTNLPKEYADEMDIDYLVVFRGRDVAPRTLIRRLLDFAGTHYPRNDTYQSSPAVVIAMSAVRFELVPARKTLFGLVHTHEIPTSDGSGWMGTNPLGFEERLTRRNAECHYKLKAAIRLAKIWNAENSYVFNSYRLENYAVDRSYPLDSNLREYFCRLMLGLPEDGLEAQWRVDKVLAAKTRLRKALEQEAAGKTSAVEKTLDQLFGVR